MALAERLLPSEPPARPGAWIILPVALLATAFLAAGLGRLLDFGGFAVMLDSYRLLPGVLLPPLLALAKLLVAVALLLLPEWRRHVAMAAALLLALDLLVVAAVPWGLANDGGFGAARPLIGASLMETAALLAVALSLLVVRRRVAPAAPPVISAA